VLLEMYSPEESVFNQSLSAYRLGDYKLIRGTVRDDNYYYESTTNRINSSHPSLGSVLVERLIDLCDAVFGKGQCDTINIVIVHVWMPDIIALTDRWLPSAAAQRAPHETSDFRLYNIVRDPCEQTNLAGDPQYASIIAAIDQETANIAAHRRHVLPLDLQLDISLGGAWSKHHVSGDCSANRAIKPRHCRFTHSWVPDVSSQVPPMLSLLLRGQCIWSRLTGFNHIINPGGGPHGAGWPDGDGRVPAVPRLEGTAPAGHRGAGPRRHLSAHEARREASVRLRRHFLAVSSHVLVVNVTCQFWFKI
jgi:hypothetical protein